MSIGIDFILRSSTDGFTAGVAKANNSVKDLKKELHEWGGASLGHVIGIAGIIEGFKLTLEHAQKVRDELEKMDRPVDKATRSVAEYADQWDNLKKVIGEVSVATLGWFTSNGEHWGAFINRMRGVSAEQEALNDKVAQDTEKSLERISKARTKFLEENSPEKLAAAEDRYAAAVRKNIEGELSGQTKINVLREDYAGIEKEIQSLNPKTVAFYEKSIELSNKAKEIDDEELKLQKAKADAVDHALDEFFKELDVKAQIVAKEREHKGAIEESTEELKKQRAAAAEAHNEFLADKEAEAQAMSQKIFSDRVTGGLHGEQLNQASDAQLQEVIRRDRQRVVQLAAGQGEGSAFSFGNSTELARLRNELDRVQKELSFRDNFRTQVDVLGESGARRMFQGDPLQFDNVLQQLLRAGGGITKDEKTANNIEKLTNVVTNAFRAQ